MLSGNSILKTDEVASVARRMRLCAYAVAILVAGFTAARILFFFQYSPELEGAQPWEVVRAFIAGLRFDVSTAVIVNSPFILLVMIPGIVWARQVLRVLMGWLLSWHLVLLFYIFIDVQYYAFAARHLTFEIKNTWQDAGVFIKIGLMDYLGPSLALLAFMALFSFVFILVARRLTRDIADRPRGRKTLAVESAGLVLVVGICLLLARGGFQPKALGINDAYFSENPIIGALALNGVFTTLDNLNNLLKGDDSLAYLKDFEELGPEYEAAVTGLIVAGDRETSSPEYPLLRKYNYAPEEARRMNVVILVMESWSAKYMGALGGEPSATPFFDFLAPKGLLMENCFANAQRSVEGLPAVLGSLPSWKGLVFGKGGLFYQSRIEPVPLALSRQGYATMFAHGAPADSMRFEGIVKRLGFATHMSMKDFPDYKKHHDGVWGVYDEHVLLSVEERLRQMKEPFFTVVYTLSSHTPYAIPSEEFRVYGEDVKYSDFLNSFRYSDHALGKFFERARESEYFDNTLFVITADHAEGRSTSGRLSDRYHIPCFFYTPGGEVAPGRMDVLAGQVDVMPTIVDILRLSVDYTGWGRSMLAPGRRALVLPQGDRFIYVEGDYMLYADTERPIKMFNYRSSKQRNLLQKKTRQLWMEKAEQMHLGLRQYLRFSYGLIRENRIAPPREIARKGGQQ